uniref:VIT domain-containing protein n=1 Tax=Mola mola TaxID=94237 RepID=A0A3Q3WDY1_MOLML
MVGLRNCSTWEPLLLKASSIKSCANGYSLGITAHLTYANADTESVEGVFVYPLGEKEVVVGFEATIAGRLVGVQIQSQGKLKQCCLDCCPGSGLEGHCGNGHLILDEDLERTTFIVGTGVIGPLEIVSIVMSTTLELPTLENGAIRIVYPTLLTPIVTDSWVLGCPRPTSCFGAASGKQDRVVDLEHQCAHSILTRPAANLAPYELNFQLLVRGACLLAGLESPTHALRADADPSAQSASATYITLAQEHPYDRHIEIILHLSEPHSPLVILERGRLTFSQYEEQICSRRDYIRFTRKDLEPERKVEFVRKRYHKDILSSPVLMLNFCPDLLCEPLELHKATRELLFLVDRSGSMSAMVVALKSLPSGTKLNVVGFGTTIKPLFTASKLCTDVSTNLLGALSWLYQQPMQRSYPRQIFIITDGSISNVAKVLELVRHNTCAGRCFGLGLGPRACRRLLQGVAKLTGGTTEYLDDEERLQPKLIKSLKKAFEPVLTDVRIDWYLPENMEAFLSPSEIPPLYPGNHLIGYCTLYDMTNFKAKKTQVCNSTFFKSTVCPCMELDWSSDVRTRIQESSYIQEQYVLTHCSLSSERSLPTQSNLPEHVSSNFDSADGVFLPDPHSSGSVLDTGSLPQDLEKMSPPEQRSSLSRWADSAWQQNLSVEAPDNFAERVRLINLPEAIFLLRKARVPFVFCLIPLSLGPSDGHIFPASPLDWDSFTDPEYLFAAAPPDDPPPGQCRSLIHGLLSGRPMSWGVTVDLGHLWTPESRESPVVEGAGGGDAGRGREPWEEIIHQLTARSVIRDFEKLAEKESDCGHAKRYQMKAIQTSKHCNIICMYTAFTTTDGNPKKAFADRMDAQNTGLTHTQHACNYSQACQNMYYCCVYNQVRLQLASGAFLLTEIYSDRVQIPLDRLKRASPYTLHRRSLSPPFHPVTSPPDLPSSEEGSLGGLSPSLSQGQADSGRGSETDVCEGSSGELAALQGINQLAQEDLESSSWATAVALAWLEHRCAGYFMEWELVAAKADFWLRCQELPEGVDVAGLKGAARQLFLLLRHWDENIKLNMLCYNPNNM